MFLLGIASLIQLIVLPGSLALRLLKISTTSTIERFLYVFALSLYINYCAVCALTWIGVYTRAVIVSLFALEALLWLWLARNDIRRLRSAHTLNELARRFSETTLPLPPRHRFMLSAACVIILFFACLIPFSAGSAYYFSDALMHWSRWPNAWASNLLPADTRHYPQLFPTNLSLIFLFTGDSGLRFFPKVLMPFFFTGILLMFLDLFLSKRSIVYLSGLFVYAAFLLVFYSIMFILEVNADIPVSFFAFLVFYAAVRTEQNDDATDTILLVAFFAAAAANTKLAGMYVLLPAGIFILYMLVTRLSSFPKSRMIRTIGIVCAIGAAGFLWYAIRPSEMLSGLNQSMYLKPSLWARFSSAASMLYYTLGAPFVIFLAATLIASLFTREGKRLMAVMVLPALILWMFYFSADYRNLSFVIPFASLASAYGAHALASRFAARNRPALGIDSVRSDEAHHAADSETNVKNASQAPSYSKMKEVTAAYPIALLVICVIVAGTDWFFNLCMNIAYGLNAFVFRYNRVLYTTEIGYYRSVEYFCHALRLASMLLLVAIGLRSLRIRSSIVLLSVTAAGIAAGAFLLSDDAMHRLQDDDEAQTGIRNCYYRVRPWIRSSESPLIVTNSKAFSELIPPSGATFLYSADVNADIRSNTDTTHGINVRKFSSTRGEHDALFLLIDTRTSADSTHRSFIGREVSECFDDGEFVFLRADGSARNGR
ncbi:MAG TPA: hypothetical protein VK470_01445 [Bacteroidota bacterium]|nr:hypothetical protein [Bacteroidota bacterium]